MKVSRCVHDKRDSDMTYRFTGHFTLHRPLMDLLTPIDMSGLAIAILRTPEGPHVLVSRTRGLNIDMAVQTGPDYSLSGSIEGDRALAESVLSCLSLAFGADRIQHHFELLSENGELLQSFQGLDEKPRPIG